MKHATWTPTLKPLLLGSAALLLVGLSPAISQDRSQIPGGQKPAASQSKDEGEPSARENRIDGQPGAPGRNADDSFGSSVLDKQLPPVRTPREKIKSDYNPFEKAVLGNMYVLRVVDEKNDFYVLFRVDELERGRRCKISWKKIDAPNAD